MNNYQLPDSLIIQAITMRTNGLTWPTIEESFKELGYRTKNGLPFHNANISAQVLADSRGAHLRQRTFKKKRKKSKKKVSKGHPGTCRKTLARFASPPSVLERFGIPEENAKPVPVPNRMSVADQIQTLQSNGFTPEQILAILKMV